MIKILNELWESFDQNYNIDDARVKKFIAGHFLDYQMMNFKIAISQVDELQVILHDIHINDMILNETFQVATTI